MSTSANIENVLVLQGGGSLGAYECGVYKALHEHGIKFDIVAGTSIGAVNAAIIAGSKSRNSIQDLENFWLEIVDNLIPSIIPNNIRPSLTVLYGSIYGNRNLFEPKWIFPYQAMYYYLTSPYLYDVLPLKNTLRRHIDFTMFDNNNKKFPIPRLIITATDIQDSKSVTFDSRDVNIDLEHIISCVGYPFYGISWIQKNGRYLWDGSLQSNTPLREIIHADKTLHNVKMSAVISRYIQLLEDTHDIITTSSDENTKSRFRNSTESEYRKLVQQRGAIIKNIVRIERSEDTHFLFEDADFSLGTVKHLIKQGEQDAQDALKNHS